jgi:hypothetical protein
MPHLTAHRLAVAATSLVLLTASCATGDQPSRPIDIDDPHGQLPPLAPPTPDGMSVTATAPGALHRAYEPCPVPSAEADTDEPKPSVEVGALATVGGDVLGTVSPYAAVRCR